jgi:uncharacterized membrane protein YfcA
LTDLIILIVLFFVAILIGILVTLGGIGGGPLLMPFFMLVLEIEEYTAKGTSVFIILMSSCIATIIHFRNKRINIKTAIILGCIATLGSITSTLIFDRISVDKDAFLFIFALFLIYIVIKLLKPLIREYRNKMATIKDDNENLSKNGDCIGHFDCNIFGKKHSLVKIILLFFIVGFLSNFLGIGGGVFNTPILHTVFQFPIHFAAAESTSILFVNSIYNFFIYAIRGQVDYIIGLSIGFGMIIGSYVGSSIAPKIPKHYIILVLVGLIVFTIIQILTKIA